MSIARPLNVTSSSVCLEPELQLMLKEIFLFSRPEEKWAIERALIRVIGPMYTVMPALGRGSKGGVEYGMKTRSLVTRLFARPALSSFLPKTAYYVVVDEADVEYILTAVCGSLASEGGPDDCGRGLAIVSPIDDQYSIQLKLPGQANVSEDPGTEIPSQEARTT